MTDESWRFEPISAKSVDIPSFLNIESLPIIKEMFKIFGNNPFIKFHAEDFDQYPVIDSYLDEVESILKTVRRNNTTDVPQDANVISRHLIYRIKRGDDDSLILKVRIALTVTKTISRNDENG